MERPQFLETRDKIAPHLRRLADMLDDPKNIERVKRELERLARG